MKKEIKVTYSIPEIVWSNIRKQQYLMHMTDGQLCEVLEVCSRTLTSYDKNPAVLTLDKVQKFLTATGVEIMKLIQI